jgi:4-hydroxythreonine-4-phosphate dehydrogenase
MMEKEKEKEPGYHGITKVGITIGDVNGIGAEIIMKALKDPRILQDCTPIIYGSAKVLSYYRKQLNIQDFNYQTCKHIDEAVTRKVNVVNVWSEEIELTPGKVSELGGKYAYQALDSATKDLASGKIDVLVTAPISKDSMGKSGFNFPGHTEYLADLSGEKDALMVMVSDNLRVALVTTHIPLNEVAGKLSKSLIADKIRAFEQSLRKDFALVKPKIAVLGLNPHAGENGKMGTEEQDMITPAINQVRNEGILAFGPYPADGMFGSSTKDQFDGILSMYHDQGLTGFKALAFDEGVNFTAGLPIVRTSPDHGTAFDIVGMNKARPESLLKAIYAAMDIQRNRKMHRVINRNPLQPLSQDKRKTARDIE